MTGLDLQDKERRRKPSFTFDKINPCIGLQRPLKAIDTYIFFIGPRKISSSNYMHINSIQYIIVDKIQAKMLTVFEMT